MWKKDWDAEETALQATEAGRHEYRMRGWQRSVYLLLGLFVCGMGIFIIRMLSLQGKSEVALLLALLPLALGPWLLATAFRSRLVIDGSRIEVRGAVREQSAELSEVEGYRTISTRNGSYWRLQLKEGRGSITIQKWFECDELRAWFQQLTDLDERDRKALLDKIEQSQELGATAEDRLAALKRAKQWNIGLSAVAIAAALVFGLGGDQLRVPAAIVLAVVPVALIYLVHSEPLLYAIFKPKRDPRTDLGIAFLASGMGLIFGNRGVHFIEWQSLMEYAALVAVLCCAGIFSSARRNPQFWGAMIGMLFFAGAYGWGVAAAANTALDHSTPANYTATVESKHVSRGRSTTYYLDLSPWGPMQGRNDVSVSGTTYENTSIGDQVCLEVRPGVLHVQWYRMVACGRMGQ